MVDFSFFNNWDLLSVGIVMLMIGLLGFITVLNDPKSLSNRIFGYFTLITIFWSVSNYASYHLRSPDAILWFLRLEIFFAAWLVYLLFALLAIFPRQEGYLPKKVEYLSIFTAAVSLLNLTPLVFIKITSFSSTGQVSQVLNGPGIYIFGLYVFSFVISALTILVKKTFKAAGLEKKQFRSVLVGIAMTFTLVVIFNFVFPAFLNNPRYISWGAVFIFPLIVSISYSIIRHQLWNVKILTTEILVAVLTLALLLEIVLSQNFATVVFRFSIFLLVMSVGFLLVKSVRKEVQQREQLEILSKQLSEANEKLKELDQARADFISIASHQLRTPPATVKWYMSALLAGDYGKVPEELKEKLKKVQQTNDHLISLIEDMLNVSRIERGKMEFLFAMTDVGELAQYAFDQLVPIAQDKKLKYSYKPPAKKLPTIMADHEKLRQVMNNLIDNSLKYTKAGSVDVQLLEKDGNIVFQVKDSGKGIAPEEKSTIFEKFSRGKESVKQSAGLGLGLYVAKIIIEQHKGKIWAESPGNGKGSIFSFSIPINNGLKETTLVDLTAPK